MPTITYYAKSSLVSGHIIGTDYSILFSAKECTPENKIDREQVRSISGKAETVVHARWREWSIQTIPIDAAKAAQFIEFLDSCLDGSLFTFDELATALDGYGDPVPVRPVECELLDQQAKPTPVGPGKKLFTVSFSIRETGSPSVGVL